MKPDELIAAINAHDLARAAELLAQGVDPNQGLVEHSLSLPLHAAVEEVADGGSTEAVALLLRHGARVDGQGERGGETPLLLALKLGLEGVVLMLLDAGADPNLVSDEGDSPLRWSVEDDDLEMAATLLRFGAARGIDRAGGPDGMNALGHAVRRLNVPMIKLLLDAGADPKARDADDRTARDCLPGRETNASAWDEAARLLGGSGKP